MTKTVLRLIGLAALLAAAAVVGADTLAPERIVDPLSNPGKPALIHADLMFGSIKITGYEGKDVIVEARPTAKPIGGKRTAGGVKITAPSMIITPAPASAPAVVAAPPAPPAPGIIAGRLAAPVDWAKSARAEAAATKREDRSFMGDLSTGV